MRSARVSMVGKSLADPSRAEILWALSSGRPRTAGQLAALVGLAASTTSRHLSLLLDAGLVVVEPAGRHRFFRLASPQVADLLTLIDAMDLSRANQQQRRDHRSGLTRARTCYDHLAGELGIRIYRSMVSTGHLEPIEGEGPRLTALGHAKLQTLGIDTPALGRSRRPLVRACLDWEQQTHHLGGACGGALLDMMISQRWLRSRHNRRTVEVTPFGTRQLDALFPATPAGCAPPSA